LRAKSTRLGGLERQGKASNAEQEGVVDWNSKVQTPRRQAVTPSGRKTGEKVSREVSLPLKVVKREGKHCNSARLACCTEGEKEKAGCRGRVAEQSRIGTGQLVIVEKYSKNLQAGSRKKGRGDKQPQNKKSESRRGREYNAHWKGDSSGGRCFYTFGKRQVSANRGTGKKKRGTLRGSTRTEPLKAPKKRMRTRVSNDKSTIRLKKVTGKGKSARTRKRRWPVKTPKEERDAPLKNDARERLATP